MRFLNNPFNIRYNSRNRWIGLSGSDNGFCTFSSLMYGIRAAAYLLMISYRRRGLRTYAELISAFAPPAENSTDDYIKYVCDSLHVMPFDVPNFRFQFSEMLHFMWIFEQGNDSSVWSSDKIYYLIYDFKIFPYGEL